jgi:hypothetical protein
VGKPLIIIGVYENDRQAAEKMMSDREFFMERDPAPAIAFPCACLERLQA